MATLYRQSSRGTVGYRVQFLKPHASPNDPRSSLWLGTVPQADADAIVSHIDSIVDAINNGRAIDKGSRKWLASLPDKLHNKLATLELCEPRTPPEPVIVEDRSLQTLAERYLKTTTKKKLPTQKKLRQAADKLQRYFGATRAVDSITSGDAQEWAIWMAASGNSREGKPRNEPKRQAAKRKTTLSESTVRRSSGLAKQILDFAVDLRWITENPFAKLVASVQPNEERMFFVDQPTVQAILDSIPDNSRWRAIIALARFGGLRIPSELSTLKWSDIDFQAGRMTIHATKTEHHRGKGIRVCPLFPELRPYLLDLAQVLEIDIETPPTEPVFVDLTGASNLRTQFEKIIKAAGVAQWPKLFQNLRASRETELMSKFPAKDVCSWIGNSLAIAMKHYVMATDESFRRAIESPTVPLAEMPNAKSVGQNVGQNVGQSGPITRPYESSSEIAQTANPQEMLGFEESCEQVTTQEEIKNGRYWTRGKMRSTNENTRDSEFQAVPVVNVGQNVGQSLALSSPQESLIVWLSVWMASLPTQYKPLKHRIEQAVLDIVGHADQSNAITAGIASDTSPPTGTTSESAIPSNPA
jgi:integrase